MSRVQRVSDCRKPAVGEDAAAVGDMVPLFGAILQGRLVLNVTPLISVVMPTFNGAMFLRAAMESIVAQGDENVEVIVVDDGSSDATLEIAESFSKSLRLRIEARSPSGNWVAGTNRGVALAQGEYVCWLHQDDAWHPSRLRILRSLMNQHPESDLFLHPTQYINAKGRVIGNWQCPLPGKSLPLLPEEVVPHLLIQNFISTPAPLFKRRAAIAAGPLDEQLWYTADWDYWLRLSGCGGAVYCAEPLSMFRLHPHSQSMSSAEDISWQLESVLNRHLEKWSNRLPDKELVECAARFSVDVNVALFRLASGDSRLMWKLGRRLISLSPRCFFRYVRDSRIIERVAARKRAQATTRLIRCRGN